MSKFSSKSPADKAKASDIYNTTVSAEMDSLKAEGYGIGEAKEIVDQIAAQIDE